MREYATDLERLQQALARQALARPELFGGSPRSLLWKLDPFYYAARAPQFIAHWAAWAAMRPVVAADVLLRTGVLVSKRLPSGRKTTVPVRLVWSRGSAGGAVMLPVQLFVARDIDRALQLHGVRSGPAVSPMRIHAESRPMLQVFLADKTMLSAAAFQ